MDLNQFLQWLLGSGGSIMAASWLLERIDWFQKQTSDIKEYVFFGLTAVISVGAYLVVNYIPSIALQVIAPYFAIVAGLFITVVIGKMFHKVDKS
jgi:hypothetical protein